VSLQRPVHRAGLRAQERRGDGHKISRRALLAHLAHQAPRHSRNDRAERASARVTSRRLNPNHRRLPDFRSTIFMDTPFTAI